MKIDILDAHDRYKHFISQNFNIGECCQNIIDQRPFGNVPFYIFAHTRTDDDGVTKRLIWQPRLTKPKSQTNSMLFKAYPCTDIVKIIWMIPAREMWDQYKNGNLSENKMVCDSIKAFEYERKILDAKEEDDLSDEKIHEIYKSISQEAKKNKMLKQASLAASTVSL